MSYGEVTVKILFFAKAKELVGLKEAYLNIPSATSPTKLLKKIVSYFSLHDIEKSIVLAINEEWLENESYLTLKENDTIAVIPPLSGDVEKIWSSVKSDSCGAVSLFIGTTRDTFEGKSVSQLEYEAYESMATKSLNELANDLREKFQINNVAIFHRLGVVPVGEASVVIAISSEHRKASLEAVACAIDLLKANVPIFKKEVYSDDGSSQWKANSECISGTNDPDITHLENISGYQPTIPNELVQINASAKEINRRITSFMKRKREELDKNNLQDFCFHGAPVVENEYSCARVDSVLLRNKNSHSHLKVSRVENLIGPQLEDQTNKNESASLFNKNIPAESPCPGGVDERLTNAEKFLGLTSGTVDVFSRLKAVEDRILYLESISPEYLNIGIKVEAKESGGNKKISNEELKQKVMQLEKKLQSKVSCNSIR